MMDLDFLIHQRFEFMGFLGAERNQAQIIAEEFDGVVVAHEPGKVGEQSTLFRIFDMLFER